MIEMENVSIIKLRLIMHAFGSHMAVAMYGELQHTVLFLPYFPMQIWS